MKITPIKCTQCGGNIVLNNSSPISTCEFCGTTFYVSFNGSSSIEEYRKNYNNPVNTRIIKLDVGPIKLGLGVNKMFEPEFVDETMMCLAAISFFTNRTYRISTIIDGYWGEFTCCRYGDKGEFTDHMISSKPKVYPQEVKQIELDRNCLASHGFETSVIYGEGIKDSRYHPNKKSILGNKQTFSYGKKASISGQGIIKPKSHVLTSNIETITKRLWDNDEMESIVAECCQHFKKGASPVKFMVSRHGVTLGDCYTYREDERTILYSQFGMNDLTTRDLADAFSIVLFCKLIKESEEQWAPTGLSLQNEKALPLTEQKGTNILELTKITKTELILKDW